MRLPADPPLTAPPRARKDCAALAVARPRARHLVIVGGTATAVAAPAATLASEAAGQLAETTFAPVPGQERLRAPHFGYGAAKRLIDIVGALAILLFTLPIIVAALLLVAVSSGRPLFFGQRRIGSAGRPFTCWKFRTMDPDAELRTHEVASLDRSGDPTAKHPDDPRVTAAGRYLRELTIDELPQLWNVLRGEMSLVGPRPLVRPEVADRDHPPERLYVKPGLTCTWQLAGRSEISFAQRMSMDLDYVRRRSLWLDLVLLLRTPLALITRRGAY